MTQHRISKYANPYWEGFVSKPNRGERGLFRLLVGAALAHAVWKVFWKWALPKKGGVLKISDANLILKDAYLEPLRAALRSEKPILCHVQPGMMVEYDPTKETGQQATDHFLDSFRYMTTTPQPKPTKWQQRKRRAIAWVKSLKPVIMTQRQKEDLEYYD